MFQFVEKYGNVRVQGHTGLMAAVAPWVDGSSWKLRLAAAGRSAPILVYVRDKDSGRITLDAEGQPCISYWPSKADADSMLKVRLT